MRRFPKKLLSYLVFPENWYTQVRGSSQETEFVNNACLFIFVTATIVTLYIINTVFNDIS